MTSIPLTTTSRTQIFLRCHFLLLWIVCIAQPVYAELSPGLQSNLTFTHDGLERRYDLYVPEKSAEFDSVPLLLDIHGFSLSKLDQRDRSGFDNVADTHGFVVVYPQGIMTSQNRLCLNVIPDFCTGNPSENVDDPAYLAALASSLAADDSIDPARVYVTGFSNGGIMAARLACEYADLFAAAAVFSGFTVMDPSPPCEPSRPISVIALHGTTDDSIPFNGGTYDALGDASIPQRQYPSQADNLDFWKQTNGCIGKEPDKKESLGSITSCETYTNCSDGVQAALCTTQGSLNPHSIYINFDFLDLAAVAWDFLSQFALPATTSVFADQVQEIYIAYYGRPGDPGGMDFWAERLQESGGDLRAIIDSFGNSSEFTDRYGGLAHEELVNNIYLQLFGRDADPEGLNFYVGRLTNGEQTLGSIALSISDGVREGTTDFDIVMNKLTVANTFTAKVTECDANYGADEINGAKEIIDSVSANQDSVEAALSQVEAFLCQ